MTEDLSSRLWINADFAIDTGNNSIDFSSRLEGSSGGVLTKKGAGTLSLSGGASSSSTQDQNISGLNIDEGTLIDNASSSSTSSISILPALPIDVASGATFNAFETYTASSLSGDGAIDIGNTFVVNSGGSIGSIIGGSSSAQFTIGASSSLSFNGTSTFQGTLVVEGGGATATINGSLPTMTTNAKETLLLIQIIPSIP